MMVYTTGQGAHGFTLDPSLGEFLLSHPDIQTPETGKYLSVNDSYEHGWDEPVKALMRRYRGLDGVRQPLENRQTRLRDRYRRIDERQLPEAYDR